MKEGFILILSLFSLCLTGCTYQEENDVNTTTVEESYMSLDAHEIIEMHTWLYSQALNHALMATSESPAKDKVAVMEEEVEKYLRTLNAYERGIARQDWRSVPNLTRTSDEIYSLSYLPDSLRSNIEDTVVASEYEDLELRIRDVITSDWYHGLDEVDKIEVYIDLQLISSIRSTLIETLKGSETRCSPGDRMVWRASMAQLTPAQRRIVLDAILAGLGAVAPKVVGLGISILTLFI